jgi:hypothetical protein
MNENPYASPPLIQEDPIESSDYAEPLAGVPFPWNFLLGLALAVLVTAIVVPVTVWLSHP